MAIIFGGKHFGQYTYEHWFDHEYENKIIIEHLKMDEINIFKNLIEKAFDEFVGKDYSQEGNKIFKDFIEPNSIIKRYNDEFNRFFVLKINDEMVGALETKNNNHISLFFVKKEFLGNGLGKKLFEYFLQTLKQNNIKIETITVNSSIFAEKINSKMGFIKIAEMLEKNGIKYIPMEYKPSANVT